MWAMLFEGGGSEVLSGLGIVSRPLLASALYAGLTEGFSGAAMLRIMRAGGVGMRTQDFYRVLRSARAFQGAAGQSAGEQLSSWISDGATVDVGGAAKDTYTSVVTVHYTQEIDGENVQLTKDIFVRGHSVRTVGQVVQKAYSTWADLQRNERYPLGEPTALEYGGTVWQTPGA